MFREAVARRRAAVGRQETAADPDPAAEFVFRGSLQQGGLP